MILKAAGLFRGLPRCCPLGVHKYFECSVSTHYDASFSPFSYYCEVAAGLTYRDMYLGRQNLPEAWRMPQHWESDGAEMALEDLDRVRLVLSYRGLNLLSNSYEPFFVCVQVRPHMHLRTMHACGSYMYVPQGSRRIATICGCEDPYV